MKKTVLASYAALIIVLILPFITKNSADQAVMAAPNSAAETALSSASSSPTSSPTATVTPVATETKISAVATEKKIDADTVSVLHEGQTLTMEMEEYLLGVVAAEMPAGFESEALKAQAVAARTFALYCAFSKKHDTAQLCTEHSCCQAWQSEETLRQRWGENYEKYREKISTAVAETKGQYLSYQGEPIFAAFHSSSAGATESCADVWNPRAYLVSVSSPETAQDVPEYVSTVRCTPLDFRDTVLYACPDADFTGVESDWIGEIVRDGSGRVSSVTLGGEQIEGAMLRGLFKLRSTAFELSFQGGEFIFTVTGYGHGVGMSQYGANVMAREGANYSEILAHYYQGTSLVNYALS